MLLLAAWAAADRRKRVVVLVARAQCCSVLLAFFCDPPPPARRRHRQPGRDVLARNFLLLARPAPLIPHASSYRVAIAWPADHLARRRLIIRPAPSLPTVLLINRCCTPPLLPRYGAVAAASASGANKRMLLLCLRVMSLRSTNPRLDAWAKERTGNMGRRTQP